MIHEMHDISLVDPRLLLLYNLTYLRVVTTHLVSPERGPSVSLMIRLKLPDYRLRLAHALTRASKAGDRIGVLTVWNGFRDTYHQYLSWLNL
jgi:hypothetical protein